MNRVVWILSVLAVVILAMGFTVANAGERVTLHLGFIILYQVPVAVVAFCGLFVGMLVMFATGIHSDLKVRRILRERLADEAQRESTRIDRSQQDLFAEASEAVPPENGGPPLRDPGASANEPGATEKAPD